MATDLYKVLYQGQLPSSTTSLYSPASGKGAIIRHWRIHNSDASSRTFSLYINGTAAANVWFKDVSLGAGESAEWDGTMALDDADSLQGIASAASQLTLTVFGDEVTY
jgi:hypothetical protein